MQLCRCALLTQHPCPRSALPCLPAWPAGKMFPRLGRVHVCAFSDEALMSEV